MHVFGASEKGNKRMAQHAFSTMNVQKQHFCWGGVSVPLLSVSALKAFLLLVAYVWVRNREGQRQSS